MAGKGVILAGGKGTRMLPATRVTNKHMLPILNRPMIEYPLETLKKAGISDILIVSGGNHVGSIAEYLGDGSDYGVNLTYKVQKEAGGIAQALMLAKDFVGDEKFAVILGDNVYEDKLEGDPEADCTLFVKYVSTPQRFGVYDRASNSIEEKPLNPKSNLAVTGLYFYDKKVFDFLPTLNPSARNELEITDVNNWYISNNKTTVKMVDGFWSDAGTPDSMKVTIDWVSNI